MACNGLKKGSFHLVRHPKQSRIIFGRHIFDLFWTHFWLQNNAFSRRFVTLEGPKWLAVGSKSAHFTWLGTPNSLGSFLEDTFLSYFGPIFGCKTTHFQGIL